MVTALEGHTEWESTKRQQDGVGILDLIYELVNHQDGGLTKMVQLVENHCALYTCTQDNRTVSDYAEAFRAQVKAISEAGGTAGANPVAAEIVVQECFSSFDSLTDPEKEEVTKELIK